MSARDQQDYLYDQSTSLAGMDDSDNECQFNETESDSEREKLENNEDVFYLIRHGASKEAIEKALSKKGVNISYQNRCGDTTLHVAVREVNRQIVEVLINKGAKVDITNNKKETVINLVEKELKRSPDDLNLKEIKNLLESARPSTSKAECPSDGKASCSDSKTIKLGVDKTAFVSQGTNLKDTSAERLTSHADLDRDPPYCASGAKVSLHGFIFQYKLLQLCLKRGIKAQYDFRLATEMDAAEKFDDVVFKYKDQGKWVFRFLQAKHKLDAENNKSKITIEELKSLLDKKPFSLQKYFTSFCKIKNNALFKEAELRDFVIITNADFDCNKNLNFRKDAKAIKKQQEHNKWIEKAENLKTDHILYFGGEAVKYKIHENAKAELTGVIKQKIFQLQQKFIDFEKKKDQYENSSNLNKGQELNEYEYEKKLNDIENELIELKDKISEAGITSRDMKDLIKKCESRIPKKTLNEIQKEAKSDLEEEIRENTIKKLEEIISELSVIRLALNDNTLDKYVTEFVEKFRFVTNFPNERELGALIKDELGERFNLLNADLLSDAFEREMLDFLRSCDNGKAEFYSWQDGNEFFKALEGKIDTLSTAGLSALYLKELRAYGIEFNSNILQVLEDFLFSAKQILHVATQDTRLSAMKLCNALNCFDAYKKRDSLIFICLKILLGMQNCILNSFDKPKTHDLLVIEYQAELAGVDLYTRLKNILGRNEKKKIIFIAPREDAFILKFKDMDSFLSRTDETSFKDLDSKSQDKLLEKEVNFQGVPITLQKLIDKKSASRIIDQANLSRLLKDKNIQIGDQKAFSSVGYEKHCYIERTLHSQWIRQQVINLKEAEAKELGLLFITGASREDLITLGAKVENIHIWKVGKSYDKGILLHAKSQSGRDIFQQLTGNVHWLKFQNSNFGWITSKGNFSALKKYIAIDNVSEKYFSNPKALGQNVVIIANDPGVGKSTLLTSVAQQMKKTDAALWVVRCNLNDYAERRKETSLENIVFQENNTTAAIEFVSKMVVTDGTEDNSIQFQRKLFEESLQSLNGSKLKTVILFDGFDEISPSHKTNTTTLMKALQSSKVCQIWVTTRVHEERHLKKELESPVYFLNSLNEDDKKIYLCSFWRWNLTFYKNTYGREIQQRTYRDILAQLRDLNLLNEFPTNQPTENVNKALKNYATETAESLESLKTVLNELDFSQIAKDLLKELKSLIGGAKDAFIDVPLNLRMLAEVVFEKKLQLPKNFGLYNLYEDFIKIKFDIYHREKAKLQKGNEVINSYIEEDLIVLTEIHQDLALKLLFSKEYENKLLPVSGELNKFREKKKCKNKNANQELARVGLLTLKRGQLDFVHQSFAEYFFSKYLADAKYLHNEQVQALLLNKILLLDDYAFIRKFFSEQIELSFQFKLEKERLEELLGEGNISKYELNNKLAQLKGHHIRHLLEIKLKDAAKILLANSNQRGTALHVVALEGHKAIVEVLLDNFKSNEGKELQKGLDEEEHHSNNNLKKLMFSTSKQKQTALLLAAREGHTEIVQALLRFVENCLEEDHPGTLTELLFKPDECNRTPLHSAAGGGHIVIVHHLLNSLKNHLKKDYPGTFEELLLKVDHNGQTPLHLAAENGHAEVVQALLNFAENDLEKYQAGTLKKLLLKTNALEKTPLHLAAEKGYSEIVQALLNFVENALGNNSTVTHKELLLKSDTHKQASLNSAVREGHKETLSLVENNFKNDRLDTLRELLITGDKHGQTPLHLAAKGGHNEIVQALLYLAGNKLEKVQPGTLKEMLFKVDESHQTPLYLAAEGGHTGIVQNVLKSVENQLEKEHPGALKELLLKGNYLRKAPLHVAAEHGQSEVMQALLSFKEDYPGTVKEMLLKPGKYKPTFRNLPDEIVQVVLSLVENYLKNDHSSNLEEVQPQMYICTFTPLHLTARRGRNVILNELLHSLTVHLEKVHLGTLKKLLVNADENNQSPWNLAAMGDNNETLQALLKLVENKLRGYATGTLKELLLTAGRNTETPLHLAVDRGHGEIVQALLNLVDTQLEKYYPGTLKALLLKTNTLGRTPLHLALQKGHTEIVKTLLSFVENHIGKDHPDTLKELMFRAGRCTQTPLYLAVDGGHNEIVQALLNLVKNYLEIYRPGTLKELLLKTNNFGRTPLHLAAMKGPDKMLKYMLSLVESHLEKDNPGIIKELLSEANEYE